MDRKNGSGCPPQEKTLNYRQDWENKLNAAYKISSLAVFPKARFFDLFSSGEQVNRSPVSMRDLFFWIGVGKTGEHQLDTGSLEVFFIVHGEGTFLFLRAHQDFCSVPSGSFEMVLLSIFFSFIIKAHIKERPIGKCHTAWHEGRAGTAKTLL